MADETVNVLHYGTEQFTLEEDSFDLAHRMVQKLESGGGLVDVMTDGGGITLLVTTGVPIWFDRRKRVRPAAATRIR